MTIYIERQMRDRVNDMLLDALHHALNDYYRFVTIPGETKTAADFRDYHVACRAAVGHIESLFRLARWVVPPASESRLPSAGLCLPDMADADSGDYAALNPAVFEAVIQGSDQNLT